MAFKIRPENRIPLLKQLVAEGKVKLLFMDCETSPVQAWIWSPGEQYVDVDQVEGETKVITIQYLIEGQQKPLYLLWDYKKGYGGNDAAIIKKYFDLLNELSQEGELIIIGQNHKNFDIKTINWRANLLGIMPPPHDLLKVDTLQQSRSAFKSPSHRLDYYSKRYGLGGKIKLQRQDWIDITRGDTKKLKTFAGYGLKDVEDLQVKFWRDLPYYPTLPAGLEKLLKVQHEKNQEPKIYCKHCAAQRQKRFDLSITQLTSKRKSVKCNRCGNIWEIVKK